MSIAYPDKTPITERIAPRYELSTTTAPAPRLCRACDCPNAHHAEWCDRCGAGLRGIRLDPYAAITLGVAARLIVCLICIWMGIMVATHAPNDGVAILAALACGGVIHGLLGKR